MVLCFVGDAASGADSKLACLSGLMLGGPYEGSGLALQRFEVLESVQMVLAWFAR